jgi:hypothetical protein
MRRFISTVIAVVIASMTIGCGPLFVGPKESTPPTLPDASSMTMPSFTPHQSSGLSKMAAADASVNNVLVAWVAVSWWTDTIAASFAPAVSLFNLCHSQTPVALDDNSGWKWSVTYFGFSADLVGRVEGDSARWSMTVNGNGLNNYVWFNGTSTITGKVGRWTFNDTATVGGANVPIIEFAYNSVAEDVGSIKVSVVKAGDADYGSYLRWSANGDTRSFEAVGVKDNSSLLISWSESLGSGFIQDRNTAAKYCWDTKANGYADLVCN